MIAAIAEAPPVVMLPFAVLLAAIAIAPLLLKHHWERNYHWISLGLGAVPVFYYLLVLGLSGSVLGMAHDYFSFMALVGSLYIVTGGIHVEIKRRATPLGNTVFLLAGAILANVAGATGASMLLIRPWIRMNRDRYAGFHTAFFIFLVSNIGGCLTPMGPPLFLGYLQGVPFWWVLVHCWPAWLATVLLLLGIFYLADWTDFRKTGKSVPQETSPASKWKIKGAHNLWFLAMILCAVFVKNPPFVREAIMLAAAALSYLTTSETDHAANGFTFTPIREVAWLFAGIFATMMPVLNYLETHARALPLHSAMQFYWWTGSLSAVLDNAPTYLTFLASAFGLAGLHFERAGDLQLFMQQYSWELEAISLGAVFFGAITYIGNGPNLMVKSITESAGVRTPDFTRYLCRYALPILIPIFALIGWLFFR